ncbi:MAG TPA: PAS domain-containing protein [Holophagaceae bacterium]|jgi:PAS domain S-box-containing protein|nr:PAS domain-containing protein [Holophagaceae bacterium]
MPEPASDPLALSAPWRLEALVEGQRQVVELLAQDAPLAEVLDRLCGVVEAQLPQALCSVVLLDADGIRIRIGAGPHLPPDYLKAIDGEPSGPKAGSCGTAIFRRETVIVENIATDPLWEKYKALAATAGLGACASTPIFDGAGKVLGSFAIYHRDPGPFGPDELEILRHTNSLAALAISHQQQVDALREQMERLAMAQRMAQLGFWTWLVADNRVEWSEGLYAIYGLDQATFGASFEGYLERVHPEDRARVQAAIGQALETQKPFAFEERIIRPGGGTRWLRSWGTVVADGQGRPERMVGTCLDITDLKTGELDLFQFRALIENTPDFVAMASLDARVKYVNPAGLKLVGLKRLEDAPTRTIRDFLTEEGFRQSQEIEIPAVQADGHWEGESTLRHFGGGEAIPVQISSFLVKDPSTGEPLCLATLQHDLRGQKQTEEALRQAQKLESLAVLAGGIAHDFNNLLTAILGNLELAKASLPASSASSAYLDRMGLAVGRASDLARQMLAYSGKGRMVVRAVDLNALITEMVQLITASLPKKAQFSLELAPDLPPVEADAAQLQQVVMNLVINASDALPESGGRITLRTVRRDQGPVDPTLIFPGGAPRPGPYVRLEVADTGCGMAPEVKARIFDPFFTTKPTGRGLGLSAMLGILRGHHAGIAVESEPSRGTRFALLFPAAEGPAVTQPPPSEAAFKPGGLALVVDDEPEIRETAAAMLAHLGFQCLVAADGAEAVELVRDRGGELGLVLLDLSMPKLDGREAFHAIRTLRPELKVILSSGFDLQESARDIVGQGLAGFLQKPYLLESLRQAVQNALTG